MHIPEDLTEFFHWVKQTTEAYWAQANLHRDASFQGAKWVDGLSFEEIDALEVEWGIRFPPDMRLFLHILHAVDRPEYVESLDWETGQSVTEPHHLFYNWRTDAERIAKYFQWPAKTILQDVLGPNQVWLKQYWGLRPKTNKECTEIVKSWIEAAPKLIPIYGHRFMVAEPLQSGNAVLSVWGSDIIVYGWDLRHYLLTELREDLTMLELSGKTEEQQEEFSAQYDGIRDALLPVPEERRIPYWEDMVLYWSSGWASMGKKYPYPSAGAQPIVPADSNSESPQQKIFTQFDEDDEV